MRGCVHAIRTLKDLVADLRIHFRNVPSLGHPVEAHMCQSSFTQIASAPLPCIFTIFIDVLKNQNHTKQLCIHEQKQKIMRNHNRTFTPIFFSNTFSIFAFPIGSPTKTT